MNKELRKFHNRIKYLVARNRYSYDELNRQYGLSLNDKVWVKSILGLEEDMKSYCNNKAYEYSEKYLGVLESNRYNRGVIRLR